MRKLALFVAALIIILPTAALARGHQNSNARNQNHDQSDHQRNGSGSGPSRGSGNNSGSNGGQPPVVQPPVITPPVTAPTGSETRFIAYTTGYDWPDNTPAGGAISNGVIHSTAGGTGTYADPITVAVGHSIINDKDILDYSAGTKFYVPNLRRYFIVEDACGDGNSPQNGPCHTGYQGDVWLDLWVGGAGLSSSGTLACEDAITNMHLVIENPAPTYTVVSGPVFNGSCTQQYGDTII
jgi:hypothetical protein